MSLIEGRPARSKSRMRAAAMFALGFALSCALFAQAPAAASDLIVVSDQSQLLRLPRAVSSVIIGNPSIADVNVQASNLLVVTGKSFGITNIIALDAERNIIQDQRIVVTRDETRTVNLNKGGKRRSFSCTPNCSPMLTIGDEEDYFSMVSNHAQAKAKFAEGAGANDRAEGQ